MLSPDVAVERQNSATLERELIFGAIKSFLFYKEIRDVVCPWNYERRSHRRDFTVKHYNTLWRAIDAFWRKIERSLANRDQSIPQMMLIAYFCDWGNRHDIDPEEARQITEEIEGEAQFLSELTLDHLRAVRDSDEFKDWIQGRVSDHAVGMIKAQHSRGILTLESLRQIVEETGRGGAERQRDYFVNVGEIVNGCIRYMPAYSTGFDKLDLKLGGGMRRGETALIAGINASGKTILCCQFALHWALAGVRVMLIPTERHPSEYIQRILSNHLNVPYAEFVDRPDLNRAVNSNTKLEADFVPPSVRNNPRRMRDLERVMPVLNSHLLFVDWSRGQGYNIPEHFDAAVEEAVACGWEPDIIMLDWVGGGINAGQDLDKLRHLYEAAVDHIVRYTKKTNRAAVTFAQLNKEKVKPTTSYVGMDMLAECKAMTNNTSIFIGLTARREKMGDFDDDRPRLSKEQYLCVDKCTMGPGGRVKVLQQFEYQRFADDNVQIGGGSFNL